MLSMGRAGFLVLLVALGLLTACTANGEEEQGVREAALASPTVTPVPPAESPAGQLQNINYGGGNQKLDITLPERGEAPFPVLLAIHGGHGDKRDMLPMASYFSERGYAVVRINFRDMPQYGFPAPIEDAFCALGWIYAQAAYYGFDTTRIAAVGFSAGADYAAMLTASDDHSFADPDCMYPLPDSERVAAVVTFTGVFDVRMAAALSPGHRDYYERYVGSSEQDAPERWDAASVSTWISGREAPFLLIHGAADDNIPPAMSEQFASELQAAGVPVEIYLIEGETHMSIIRSEDAFARMEEFLAEQLHVDGSR